MTLLLLLSITSKATDTVDTLIYAHALLPRYIIAVGLENGRIQLLSSVDLQQVSQWELWHQFNQR